MKKKKKSSPSRSDSAHQPSNDFLLELLTEELPPKELTNLTHALMIGLEQKLRANELSFTKACYFSTPRRLAVLIHQLDEVQPDRQIERRGPPLARAFDEAGNPTQATLGFAQSCGIQYTELTKSQTDKGAWLAYVYCEKGKSVFELLPTIVQETIQQLPIRKPMRWGSHTDTFVRPVHAVVMLYGKKVIPCEILGLQSANKTQGHRFLSSGWLTIKQPSEYESILKKSGFVIADCDERKKVIHQQLAHAAKKMGADVIIDPDLLEEVTNLTEWPIVLIGTFDAAFLEIPQEALISSMQHHQRCFPLVDPHKKLIHQFLIVSNMVSKEPQKIIQGNERVMHARLSDAGYFYRQDLSKPLIQYVDDLNRVVFQAPLGTLYEKAARLAKLTAFLAQQLGINLQVAERAAFLAKADLMTQLVGEFPELQGIMGYYYALKSGENPTVAEAIKEHYLPHYADAPLPTTELGKTLAIADRIDSLIGIFGINKKPSGDKDPFGLRRAAIGLIRLLKEMPLLNLDILLRKSIELYGPKLTQHTVENDVSDFIYERLKYWTTSNNEYTIEQFLSIDKKQVHALADFMAQLTAVRTFSTLPESKSLASANKRVAHLLEKQEGIAAIDAVDPALLKESAEKILWQAIIKKETEINAITDYTDKLKTLAELKGPVDQFFDTVMVMTEDSSLRQNRLALLKKLRALFLKVADISRLITTNT